MKAGTDVWVARGGVTLHLATVVTPGDDVSEVKFHEEKTIRTVYSHNCFATVDAARNHLLGIRKLVDAELARLDAIPY